MVHRCQFVADQGPGPGERAAVNPPHDKGTLPKLQSATLRGRKLQPALLPLPETICQGEAFGLATSSFLAMPRRSSNKSRTTGIAQNDVDLKRKPAGAGLAHGLSETLGQSLSNPGV
mmetsp:Transcript_2993/g.6246  ORF Transcript_2993/g.6246 Transcript_2993/m.6246 type:complete len:117 (+) Transcript_2993:389-739(+)